MRRVALAVASLALSVSCVACATPRNQLNTAAGQCFRSLPAARAEVGRKGELVGVHLVSRRTLARAFPAASPIQERRVCAVAFQDDYRPGDIPHAEPAGPGRFAVVILDVDGTRALTTLVVDRLPRGFGHGI